MKRCLMVASIVLIACCQTPMTPMTSTPPDPTLDSDHDGLTDEQEVDLATDPLSADTDLDGINDGDEVSLGLDPLVTNPITLIDGVYCRDILTVVGLPEVGNIGVFQSAAVGGFIDWRAGERVALDQTGARLVSVSRGFGIPVILAGLGPVSDTQPISQIVEAGGQILVVLSGTTVVEVIPDDAAQAATWSVGNPAILVTGPHPDDYMRLVNTAICVVVRVQPP